MLLQGAAVMDLNAFLDFTALGGVGDELIWKGGGLQYLIAAFRRQG